MNGSNGCSWREPTLRSNRSEITSLGGWLQAEAVAQVINFEQTVGEADANRRASEFSNLMRKTLVRISLSTLALWVVSCCVVACPADKDLPITSIPEFASTSLDEFNVRGYVIAIVICPPRNQCIRMDGVDIASEPVITGEPDYLEQMLRLRDSGEIMTLPIGVYRRFSLEVGREYLFSYRKGRGVVGVSAVD